MSLEVQLMNVPEQPSNIKREICAAIEVNFKQLFLIRSGSWDQPRRYVPPERLCFYKQGCSRSAGWAELEGPQTRTRRSRLSLIRSVILVDGTEETPADRCLCLSPWAETLQFFSSFAQILFLELSWHQLSHVTCSTWADLIKTTVRKHLLHHLSSVERGSFRVSDNPCHNPISFPNSSYQQRHYLT